MVVRLDAHDALRAELRAVSRVLLGRLQGATATADPSAQRESGSP